MQQQGQARWRTVQSWPSTIVEGQGNGARARDIAQGLTPHSRKDRTHIIHRAGGGGQHGRWMCGKVFVGAAGALCAMLLCAIYARMVSRRAARREHSSQKRRIAVSTGSGSVTGTVMRLSSTQHSLVPLSPCAACLLPTLAQLMLCCPTRRWPHPFHRPKPSLPSPRLALLTNSNVNPQPAPFPPTLYCVLLPPGNNDHWRESSLPTPQHAPPTLGNVAPWPTPFLPMPQHI